MCTYDRASDEIRGLRHGLPFPIAAGSTAPDALFPFHRIFKPEFFHFPFSQKQQVVLSRNDWKYFFLEILRSVISFSRK